MSPLLKVKKAVLPSIEPNGSRDVNAVERRNMNYSQIAEFPASSNITAISVKTNTVAGNVTNQTRPTLNELVGFEKIL
jgi:hypothetical protein